MQTTLPSMCLQCVNLGTDGNARACVSCTGIGSDEDTRYLHHWILLDKVGSCFFSFISRLFSFFPVGATLVCVP
jgi:hypothetical protein